MRKEDFTSQAATDIKKHPTGYWAAHPKKLPPPIEPSWELFQALSEADRALSELAGVARTLPNPRLLIAPFVRKEAVLSSKIEGTQASLSDLLLFEASGGSEQRTGDEGLVANYVAALDAGLQALNDLPLSFRLFNQLHGIIVRDPTKTPGEIRRSQNWIGHEGCNLHEASYVPPPPEDLPIYTTDLEKYLHQKGNLPPLIKYAIAHYQFEAMHPFLDGNGRLGRLLVTLLLCADPTLEASLLPQPLLYLSAYFERNRAEYYNRLDRVSKRGEWVPWITYFLRGVAEQSKDAVEKADRLFELKASFLNLVREARGSALVHQITEYLFDTPVVSIKTVAKRHGRSFTGAQKAVNKLVGLGILREQQGQRSRLYGAWDVIRLLED